MAFIAKKENFVPVDVFLAVTIGAAFMIVGANLPAFIGFFINHLPEIIDDPLYLKNWKSGGGYYFGAFAGAILFILTYVRKFFKKRVLNFMDIAAVSLPLGQAVGRLGCFMAGCCYGKPTNLPWGVKFSSLGSAKHPFFNTALHPTQLYEFILNIFNFIFLFFFIKKKKFNGQVFSQYLINYGIIRFFLEYFRGDVYYIFKSNTPLFSLTFFQMISIILFLSGILMKNILKRKFCTNKLI